MLAPRTDKVLGERVALVNVAAYLTYVSFCLGLLGPWLDVGVIVAVGHSLGVGYHLRVDHLADKHYVRVKVDKFLGLKRNVRIYVFCKIAQSVFGAGKEFAAELVGVSAALEAELFKNGEGRVDRQTVYIHLARVLDYLVGVVCLVYRHGNSVRGACDLHYGVEYAAVVLYAVIDGHNVKTVAYFKEGSVIGSCIHKSHLAFPCVSLYGYYNINGMKNQECWRIMLNNLRTGKVFMLTMLRKLCIIYVKKADIRRAV